MRIWSYEALPSWKIIVWVTQLLSNSKFKNTILARCLAVAIALVLRVLVTSKGQYYLLLLRYDPIFNAKGNFKDETWFC